MSLTLPPLPQPFNADEAFGRAVEAAKRETFDTIREVCSKGGCHTLLILNDPRVRAEVLAELCKLGYECAEDTDRGAAWWIIKW